MSLSVVLVRIIACGCAFIVGTSVAAPVARCPFDNELVSAQREGMIYARYALSIRAGPLVAATGFAPEHAAAAQALMECPSCWPQLDINGSGAFDTTDALIIARHIAGFRGAALTNGLTLTGSRDSSALVQSFIADGCSVATPVVVLAAGDIAYCPTDAASANAAATASVLRRVPGVPVLTLGDNAYVSGTAAEFSSCFAPTWGVELPRLRPSPGNHDYGNAGAGGAEPTGYFGYFGRLAGATERGYYSFDIGQWHVVSLNSNINAAAGSAQALWLRDDLANTARKCILAYWHHPVFTSSPRGDNPKMIDTWQVLSEFKVDIVLNGHEHNYERFKKQTATGAAATDGIRQFIIGSGGVGHTAAVTPLKANSELFNGLTYGVLKLTLAPSAYTWEFLPELAGVVVDASTASVACNRM